MTKLNAALEPFADLRQKTALWLLLNAARLPEEIRVGVRDNAGGHDNPLMQGHCPVLLNDVWEHACYLKYENRRAAYLAGWWAVANWKEAARRYESSDQSAEQRWEADGGHLLQAAP